ncbi:MAG: hypothetical protein HOC18_02170 [Candidatus Marinimicrobia bacterium]|jgi:hypothetical protein|nr:hypothetical protein [Candidatus Neomarinimicrobiota bacterium]
MSENTEPETVDLSTALEKMNADGHPPTGFHMMLLSPEFGKDEDCPTLQLLKKLGLKYNFADTVKRQVFQLPQDQVIISYEFAWLGGFDGIQSTMESIDKIIATQMERMVEDGTYSQKPQARISFLAEMSDGGEEE